MNISSVQMAVYVVWKLGKKVSHLHQTLQIFMTSQISLPQVTQWLSSCSCTHRWQETLCLQGRKMQSFSFTRQNPHLSDFSFSVLRLVWLNWHSKVRLLPNLNWVPFYSKQGMLFMPSGDNRIQVLNRSRSNPLVVPRSQMYQSPSIAKMVACMLLRCWSSGKLISLVAFLPTLDFPFLTVDSVKISARLGPSMTLRLRVLALLRSTRNWLDPISTMCSFLTLEIPTSPDPYMPEFCLFGDAYEGARAAAPVPDEVVTILELDLGMEPRHVFVDHMNLIFTVPADHPPLLLQRVATINGRLALLYHQLVRLVLLRLELGRLALHRRTGTPLLQLVCLLPFLQLTHTPRILQETLAGAQRGAERGAREGGFLQTSLGRQEMVVALDALSDPQMDEGVQSINFLVIILEDMPNSDRMSSSVRSAKQLPSTDAAPEWILLYQIVERNWPVR